MSEDVGLTSWTGWMEAPAERQGSTAGRDAVYEHDRPAHATDDAASARTNRPVPRSVTATRSVNLLSLQRSAGNAAVTEAMEEQPDTTPRSPVLDVVGKGGGVPLDAGARAFLEPRLGADFSDVRIHTDTRAAESARAVGASAYTVGNDVVVAQGHYEPGTPSGRHLLAHELAHVVQQRSGPVAGTPTGDGVAMSDPGDEFERAAADAADAALHSGVDQV